MLHAQNIVKKYATNGAAGKTVLHEVDFHMQEGEFVAVTGRSGSGKTTLMHVLSTLLRPDQGSISFRGQDITAMDEAACNALRRHDFAVIFQFHHLLPYLTALENTVLPFMQGMRPVSGEILDRGRECLARVGLKGKEDSLPGNLSGGEQQRVAIARALVKQASLLFADEPTGSLDKATGQQILHLLQDLNAEGLGIVMVTHDPEYAACASRIVAMEDGRILDQGISAPEQ